MTSDLIREYEVQMAESQKSRNVWIRIYELNKLIAEVREQLKLDEDPRPILLHSDVETYRQQSFCLQKMLELQEELNKEAQADLEQRLKNL